LVLPAVPKNQIQPKLIDMSVPDYSSAWWTVLRPVLPHLPTALASFALRLLPHKAIPVPSGLFMALQNRWARTRPTLHALPTVAAFVDQEYTRFPNWKYVVEMLSVDPECPFHVELQNYTHHLTTLTFCSSLSTQLNMFTQFKGRATTQYSQLEVSRAAFGVEKPFKFPWAQLVIGMIALVGLYLRRAYFGAASITNAQMIDDVTVVSALMAPFIEEPVKEYVGVANFALYEFLLKIIVSRGNSVHGPLFAFFMHLFTGFFRRLWVRVCIHLCYNLTVLCTRLQAVEGFERRLKQFGNPHAVLVTIGALFGNVIAMVPPVLYGAVSRGSLAYGSVVSAAITPLALHLGDPSIPYDVDHPVPNPPTLPPTTKFPPTPSLFRTPLPEYGVRGDIWWEDAMETAPSTPQTVLIDHGIPLYKPVNNWYTKLQVANQRLLVETAVSSTRNSTVPDVYRALSNWGHPIVALSPTFREPILMYDAEARCREWLEHHDSSKRAMYAREMQAIAANPLADDGGLKLDHGVVVCPKVFANTLINGKADEKILKLKPRPIHAMNPSATAAIGPTVYETNKRQMAVFDGTPALIKHNGVQWSFSVFQASGADQHELSSKFTTAMERQGDGMDLFVAGDDALALIRIGEMVYVVTSDFSNFDHSEFLKLPHAQPGGGLVYGAPGERARFYTTGDSVRFVRVHHHNQCVAPKSREYLLLGDGLLAAQLVGFEHLGMCPYTPGGEDTYGCVSKHNTHALLALSYRSRLILTQRNKPERTGNSRVIITRMHGERNTGGADTTGGNSQVTANIYYWNASEIFNEDNHVGRVRKFHEIMRQPVWYGITVKARHQVASMFMAPDFLKGIFFLSGTRWYWAPLLSRLVKMGTTIAHPRTFNHDSWRALASIALGYKDFLWPNQVARLFDHLIAKYKPTDPVGPQQNAIQSGGRHPFLTNGVMLDVGARCGIEGMCHNAQALHYDLDPYDLMEFLRDVGRELWDGNKFVPHPVWAVLAKDYL
jgi:hypothetical protein